MSAARMIDAPWFAVAMLNALAPDGTRCTAYIGGNGCHGFNTSEPSEAHACSEFVARNLADHQRGWYRGFAGGVQVAVQPHLSCTPEQRAAVEARIAHLSTVGFAL